VKAVIDTNVLVYDTIEDSNFHEEVRDKLYKLEKWIIPSVVLEEFALVSFNAVKDRGKFYQI